MDKHTKRYMKEFHGWGTDHLDFNDVARAVERGGEDGYIDNAINSLSDDVEKFVLKERMLKKRMGWD